MANNHTIQDVHGKDPGLLPKELFPQWIAHTSELKQAVADGAGTIPVDTRFTDCVLQAVIDHGWNASCVALTSGLKPKQLSFFKRESRLNLKSFYKILSSLPREILRSAFIHFMLTIGVWDEVFSSVKLVTESLPVKWKDFDSDTDKIDSSIVELTSLTIKVSRTYVIVGLRYKKSSLINVPAILSESTQKELYYSLEWLEEFDALLLNTAMVRAWLKIHFGIESQDHASSMINSFSPSDGWISILGERYLIPAACYCHEHPHPIPND